MIELAAEVMMAVRSPGGPGSADRRAPLGDRCEGAGGGTRRGTVDFAIRFVVAEEVRPILDELRQLRVEVGELHKVAAPTDKLVPLCKILEITPRAALGRLANDPELRGLGHRLGRRLLFDPGAVRLLLSQRQSGARHK
jgi:hypothetical protein